MKPILTLLCTLLLLPFTLTAQTASGAGELVAAIPLLSADHLQVTEFSGGVPANTGADYYKILYTTPDIEGVMDTASGLLVVPQRGAIDRAMAVYQRGTARSKQDAASNLSAGDAVFASSALAGQGMIALAPDYLGMGEARGFHPYLDKETEASAAVDMLYAVETLLEQNGTGWNGQLFLTGFSQGGHAAMALHQELQANYQNDWPVTRSAPISGPYDLSVAEDFFLDTELQYPPLVLVPFVALGQQEAEGGLYNTLEEIFAAPYAPILAQFLSPEWETGAITTDDIQNQLVETMLPLEGGLFPARMIREEYRQAMEADENHPLRAALRENSPLDWTPQAPLRLPYCEDDPIVFSEFILNAETIFLSLGADVEAINGGPGIGHGDCLPPSLFAALGFFDEVRTDKGRFVPGGLTHGDSLRTYAVYVPPGYDGSEAWPVVINMHGLGSNIEQQVFASRMMPVADTAQFLIVFPQALSGPFGPGWNDRLEPGLADDVSFLSRLIDQISLDYHIDPAKVYATGLSNGGAMSHLLACQLPDRVAAVASVAGPILEPVFENNCELNRPVPVLHIHGTADPIVPFEGGPVIIPGYLAPPVEDYVQFWVEQNNCEGDPVVETVSDVNTADSSTVEIRRYNNCDPGSEVWYYRIDNGSHVWPGGPAIPPGFEFLGTNVNQDIHASVEIWNFFARHTHPDPAPVPQLLEKTVDVDGAEREYLLYVPAAYDGSEDWPLVVNLHGLYSFPEEQIFGSQMNLVADTAHFLVAYPRGLDIDLTAFGEDVGTGWNVTGTLSENDDYAFFQQMLDQIGMEYVVNESRVYAAGLSFGGIMSHYLACSLNDRFAAVASVAGDLQSLDIQPCEPGRAVPVLHIHGTDDIVTPYAGGEIALGAEATVDFWLDNNGCAMNSTVTMFEDTDMTDGSTVTRIAYQSCDDDNEVWFYRVDGGGHTWPGGEVIPPAFAAFLGNLNRDINASSEIWNFFNRFQTTSLTTLSPSELDLQVFPNPFSTQLTFTFELPELARVQLSIFNQLGQEVQTLADQRMAKGAHRIDWNTDGQTLPAGMYFYRLQIDGQVVSRPVVVGR